MENISVERLGFSNRTRNTLMRGKVYTLSEVLSLSKEDLLKINSLGIKTVKEILAFQEQFIAENDISELQDAESDYVDEKVEHSLVINYAFPEYMGKEIHDVTYRMSNGIYVSDINIEELGFSVRTINGLCRANCKTIHQVANMNYEDLLNVKNLGSKSITEVIEYFRNNAEVSIVEDSLDEQIEKVYEAIASQIQAIDENIYKQIIKVIRLTLAKNENEIKILHVGCDIKTLLEKKRFNELLWENGQIRDIYSSCLLSMISNSQNLVLMSSDNLFKRVGVYDYGLNELLEKKKIEEHDGSYRVRLPYIKDWVSSIENDNQRQAITMKLKGKTLEECGQELGITRERVRQIINKVIIEKPTLREDDYKELFEMYAIDREAFLYIFQENNTVYNYLHLAYKHGVEPLENMENNEHIARETRCLLDKYLNKDNVLIGEEYVPCKRELLCRKLAEVLCADIDITFDDFYEQYMEFLRGKNLDCKKNLLFPSSRAFAARMNDSPYVLMKYGRKFRYYPIDQVDIDEFVDTLELEQYQDIEISTLKMVNENSELMKAYDIRDEYELHNLLKKTVDKWNVGNSYNVSINRMPLLVFGEADRKKQTEELLFQLAPISIEEFCDFYELEYGVLARTVMANFTPYISKYYHNGMYSVDQPLFDAIEMAFMRECLNEDFYFVEDIKACFGQRFGAQNIDKVNPSTLKELGYRVYTNYVVSEKYSNAYEYFKYFLLKEDAIDLKRQDRRLTYIQVVNSTLEELRSTYQLLEYGDMQFIKLSRLQRVYPDISLDMINSYVDDVLHFSKEEKYFTIRLLKEKGFQHRLHDVGLDEWFNSGLVKNSRRVRFIKTGSNVIFYQGNHQITTTDFIRYVLKREIKMDIYDFINLLKTEYGIALAKEKITQLVKPTDMYYDSIMEKLYINKNYYYEEI